MLQIFAQELLELLGTNELTEKILFPSMGVISHVSGLIRNSSIGLGAQNICYEEAGMFSGEYSIDSLIDENGSYVELGHWERRTLFHESDELINKKMLLTLKKGLVPILCIGEREKTEDLDYIQVELYRQLVNSFILVHPEDVTKVIIAYTPIWTVSQTKAANVPHIHKVCGIIRGIITKLYGHEVAGKVRIIYGGSVSPNNAKLIVQSKNIDGVFVGRFGSNPKRLAEVVKVVEENNQKEFNFQE